MTQFLGTFTQRIVGSLARRLPTGSPSKRLLVETVLWQLEEVAYSRLQNTGFKPSCVIDIGAHLGQWTRSTKNIFPDTPFIMIEAREEMRPDLERTAAAFRDVDVHIALLGPKDSPGGVTFFRAQGSASSLYRERSDAPMTPITVPMTTLDKILPPSLASPLFLKLDVQGGELDVLRGADAALKKTEVVQLEVALLPYNEGAPTPLEVFNFMDELGFAIYDIAGFVRPNARDLAQIDVIFVRKDSKLRPERFHFADPTPA